MSEKTILVADDESHILNVVSLKLRNAGFRVLTASDGREALDVAGLERPDLLITDYHMPHLSGLELCRRMRQQESTREHPGHHVDGARLSIGARAIPRKAASSRCSVSHSAPGTCWPR